MPRGTRLDAPGTLHHVIIRGIEKRIIVDNQADREDFVSRMGLIAINTEGQLLLWLPRYDAYCKIWIKNCS